MTWRKLLIWRLIPMVALAAAIAVRVVLMDSAPGVGVEDVPEFPCGVQDGAAVEKLQKLLTFRTTSQADAALRVEREAEFHAAWDYLETAFPVVWERLAVEKAGKGGLSRLLTWAGQDRSLPPLLLIAHLDVVPAGDEAAWTQPPFGGKESEGYIWGRGALDMKNVFIALLQGVEDLLTGDGGFTPARDVLVALGQDEEVGGQMGAREIAKLISSRYQHVDFIVDEGGTWITDGLPPFTRQPVHVLCTAEKGSAHIHVKINAAGGHASMPPAHGRTALELASKFVSYLSAHPMPARLQPPFADTLRSFATNTPWPLSAVLARVDTWPLSAVFANVVRRRGEAPAANVYTTMVVSRFNAGVADNVIPEDVFIKLNTRPLLGDTVEGVKAHVWKVLQAVGVTAKEAAVELGGAMTFEPSPVTSTEGHHFKLVKQAVQETCRVDGKPIKITPALLPGATDSRHYQNLTLHGTVRISSMKLNTTAGDFQRVHGVDERIGREDFLRSLCTYRRLIQLLAS